MTSQSGYEEEARPFARIGNDDYSVVDHPPTLLVASLPIIAIYLAPSFTECYFKLSHTTAEVLRALHIELHIPITFINLYIYRNTLQEP